MGSPLTGFVTVLGKCQGIFRDTEAGCNLQLWSLDRGDGQGKLIEPCICQALPVLSLLQMRNLRAAGSIMRVETEGLREHRDQGKSASQEACHD